MRATTFEPVFPEMKDAENVTPNKSNASFRVPLVSESSAISSIAVRPTVVCSRAISVISSRAGNAIMRYLKAVNGIGIFMGLTCALLYSLGSLLVKVLNTNNHIHPVMLSGIRQTFLVFMAGPQVALCKASYGGRSRREWIFLLIRAACGGLSTTLNFMAISHLPLADAGIIFATTPAFTALLAFVTIREKCRFSDFPVLFLSFLGVVFILRPAFIFRHIFPEALMSVKDVALDDRIIGCTYAICGAVVQAGVYLSLRMMRHVNFATISFVYALGSAPVLLIIAFSLGKFQIPQCDFDRFLSVSISITAIGGHAFLSLASKFIPPGIVSLTRSTEVAFGFIWQTAFLGNPINIFSICGCSLVALSMILLSIRQVVTEKYKDDIPNNKFIKCLLLVSK